MKRFLAGCLSAVMLAGMTTGTAFSGAVAQGGAGVPDWTTFDPNAITTTLTQDGKSVVASAPSANGDRMGMTLTRPLHTADGFSVRMGVDKIGSWEKGADTSWLGFSLTDMLTTSYDITGAPASKVGHGVTCLIRPESEGKMRVQIFRANVNAAGENVANDPFAIYAEYLADADGSDFTLAFEPVKADGNITGYRLLANGQPVQQNGSQAEPIGFLAKVLDTNTDFYLRTVARDLVSGQPCQFTVKAVNGIPAIAFQAPDFSDWKALDFAGNTVTTSLTHNGTQVVASAPNGMADRMGAALGKAFQLTDGFSIRAGIDDCREAPGDSAWLGLAITNKDNTNDITSGAAAQGSGLGFLIRKMNDTTLGFQMVRLNVGEDGEAGEGFVPVQMNNGEVQQVADVGNIQDFTLTLTPVVTDGAVTGYDVFVNGTRINTIRHSFMTRVLGADADCYLRLAAHNTAEGPFQFTVKEVNGAAAARKIKGESPSFSDWKAFDFIGNEVSTVLTREDAKVVAKAEDAMGARMGAALAKPFKLADGFSIRTGIDECHQVDNDNAWLGIAITNKNNTSDITAASAAQGSGLGILIRKLGDTKLGFQLVRLNIGEDGKVADGFVPVQMNSGEVQQAVDVADIRDFTLSLSPVTEGGKAVSYDVFVNGAKINVTRHTFMAEVLDADTDCYLRLAAFNTAEGAFQFTVKEVNGADACKKGETEEPEAPKPDKPTGAFELLEDPHYEQGFTVQKLSHSSTDPLFKGRFDYGNSDLTPVWSVAQWDSRHDFTDTDITTFKDLGAGKYQYENPSKRLTVDTKTGQLGLRLDASKVYDKPREGGEAWPHLLAEIPAFVGSPEDRAVHNVGNMDNLRLQMKMKLTEYQNLMSADEYDKDLHASQFVLYFQVKDVTSSNPEANMMWVGVIFMDSRKEFPLETTIIDGGKDDASGRVIYTVASKSVLSGSFFKDGQPYGSEDNEWISVDFDLLPYIQKALNRAQNDFDQMEGYTLGQLYIGEMNFGWEMPGTYKAEMQVKDLSVKAYQGVAYDGYKVLTAKDGSLVSIDGSKLTVLKDNVTLAQLKAAVNIPAGCTVAAVDAVGAALGDADVLKTGMKVRVMRGQIKEMEYAVTVSASTVTTGAATAEPPKGGDTPDTGVPFAALPFAAAACGGAVLLAVKGKKRKAE